MNLKYNIILSTALFCQLDIFKYLRGSCLPFFLLFYFLCLDRSSFRHYLVRSFPVGIRDCYVCPYSTLRVGKSFLLFSCTGQLLLYYHHVKLQLMKSLSQVYCEISPVSISLLKFGIASLTVPRKQWE